MRRFGDTTMRGYRDSGDMQSSLSERTQHASTAGCGGIRPPGRTHRRPALSRVHGLPAVSATLGRVPGRPGADGQPAEADRKSTRLNSSHVSISYAVFCLKKKKNT